MNSCTTDSISSTRRWLALGGWLLLSFAVAGLGGLFMPDKWYASLNKPAWTPPNWVFAPVWATLYTMMAVAAWLVWTRGGFTAQKRPLTLFLLQLALNGAWTPLFFGLHLPAVAFAEMLLLWSVVFKTLLAFYPVSRLSAGLFGIYLVWLSYAAMLNFSLWRMNL